jgi:hypothetical protein
LIVCLCASAVAATADEYAPDDYAPDDVRRIVPASEADLTLDRWQPGQVVRTTVIRDGQVVGGAYSTATDQPGAARPDDFPPPAGPAPLVAWPEDEAPPPAPPGEPFPPVEPVDPVDPYEPSAAPPPARAPAAGPTFRRRMNPAGARKARDGSCPDLCSFRRDECCWPLDWCGNRYGCWDITLEAAAGFLSGPEGQLGEPAFGAVASQFSWGGLTYDLALGARGSLRRQLEPQSWLELRGFGGVKSRDSQSQNGVFGFRPPVGPPPVPPITVSNAVNGVLETSAQTFGAELNYIHEIDCSGCWRWDILGGARWINFEEHSRASFNNPPIGVGAGAAFVDSLSINRFIGGQLGAAGTWGLSERLEATFGAKGLVGSIDRSVRVAGNNIFVGGPTRSSVNEDEVTFGFDIEASLKFRLTPRFALTAGYNLLFLDNVVRAYDAMDFSQAFSGAVQARQELGQLVIHTVFAGINVNF